MMIRCSYRKLLFSSILCIQAASITNAYATQVNLPPTLVLNAPHATLNPQNSESYSRTPTSVDPEGLTLTFSITNKPDWLSFDPSTGAMSGTPTSSDAGSTAGIVVSVTDGVNTVSSEPFTINVLNETGQFVLDQCFTDSFIGTGGLDDTWQVLASQGFTPTSVVVGEQSRLRLTDTGTTRAGGVSKVFPVPAVGVNQFEFLAAAYGGDGADGIAFVLSDWNVAPSLGVQGHGLGYSTSDTTNGFNGGWLAVGIDEWGNFSDPARHHGSGGPGRTPNSISVRGSGDQLTGYDYLTGTNTLSPSLDGSQTGSLYRITLDSTTKTEAYLTVERDIDPTDDQGYITIIDRFDVLSSSNQNALPEQFRVSFSASTGAFANFHDLTGLTTTGSDCASVSAISLRPGVIDLNSNSVTFTVALNTNAPSSAVSVDYATSDGTALASSEYTAQTGTLNFAQGEQEKTITVPLSALDNSDDGKNFFIKLSNASGAFISLATNSAEIRLNDAPVAATDSYTVNEGTQLTGTSVLANDTDPENDTLTAILVSDVSNGTLGLNGDGTFTYSHDGSETTSDSFAYKANDGALDSNTVTVSFTITPVNDAPVSVNDSYTVNEGAQLSGTSVLANDTDAENNSLSAILVSDVNNGKLTLNANGTFTYQHNGSNTVSDSFSYKANDGNADSSPATVNLTINPINDAPIAISDSYMLNEGAQYGGLSVLGNDVDEDSNNLTASAVSTVSNGTLTFNPNGTFIYTHNGGETTSDSFTYRANDGALESNTVTVMLSITAVNDAPVAVNDSYTVNGDEQFAGASVLANDFDAENNSLSAVLVSTVRNGTLMLNANGTFVYTHNGGDTTSDSFTYKANDGVLDSDSVSVNINIQKVNKAPNAPNIDLTVNEGDRVRFELAASDPDGDAMTYTLLSQPSNGQLTGTSPRLTYTPASDFNGADSFTYRVNDGELNSNIATVSFNVVAADEGNAAPSANNDEFNFDQTGQVTLDVLANDTDPDDDILTITSARSDFGSVSVVDNQIVFTPSENVSGRFTISYSISDDAGNVATAMATVVMSNNQGPVITLPPDLCDERVVSANGLYTRVDLGEASAVDRFGASVPVSLVDGVSLFPPGVNEVFWSATDTQGNTTVAVQRVCVLPLVSIEKDQVVLAGNATSVGVYLNGMSPVYPLVVPFEVAGSANANDHDLVAGEITIQSGTEGQIKLNTFVNNGVDADKTVDIQLDSRLNLGAKNKHQLVITDGNIAPEISLTVSQAQQQRLTVTRTGGVVDISTALNDPNLQDFHTLTWSTSSEAITNLSDTEITFSFAPEDVPIGLYQITLHASDSGTPSLSDSESVYINVVESLEEFADLTADSDSDGIPDADEGYQDKDNDGIPDYRDRISECNVLQEQVVNQDSYLIEGQPGVCLRRGQLTIGGESGGAEITGQDYDKDTEGTLVSDSDATNVGGIFDYIVYGLPEQGNSYAIVMPQRKPIPVDAVYRKYRPNAGWGFFVEDANNSLWSTQGEPGYCPPPALSSENNIWQPGLNEGHWCVQQIIQDGGANDDDGTINGTIVDPGGVAVMLNNNSLPVAIDDSVTAFANSELIINALSNDSDADGDRLTISSAVASLGTVTIEDNQLRYQPVRDYIGTITIGYGVTDQNGGTDHAVVSINLRQNLAPVLLNEQSDVNQGESVSINLLANDNDPENDALTLTSVDNINVNFDGNGQAQFTPPADFFGSVTINYTVTDASGNRSQGQWQVNVIQVHQIAARTEGGGSMSIWFLILFAAGYGFRTNLKTKMG